MSYWGLILLEHGGHLIEASIEFNIPKEKWIDLSTGINPNGWPIPVIPAECWQRLPESSDDLVRAAKQYYQCNSILPVAGSQAAIQVLPLLRQRSKVGVLFPAYEEHAHSWRKAGHEVIELLAEQIDSQLCELDVLILINPNNPTGLSFRKSKLLDWYKVLDQRGGWLIVDEAFIDTMSENSLSSYPASYGLIILRSVGKFFGLAGIRCGFVITADIFLDRINEILGPWTISHPSRYIATTALLDNRWQSQAISKLKKQAARFTELLEGQGLKVTAKTDLFQWVQTSKACKYYQLLAKKGILVRLFENPNSLRFGLPKNESQWLYLERVLKNLQGGLELE